MEENKRRTIQKIREDAKIVTELKIESIPGEYDRDQGKPKTLLLKFYINQ